jgi:hypothetical protein
MSPLFALNFSELPAGQRPAMVRLFLEELCDPGNRADIESGRFYGMFGDNTAAGALFEEFPATLRNFGTSVATDVAINFVVAPALGKALNLLLYQTRRLGRGTYALIEGRLFRRQAGAVVAATEQEATALAASFNQRFGAGAARTFADTETIGELARSYCFAPDTLISTFTGRKRIEDVNPGEHVHAFDFEKGKWVLSEVVHRHDNAYNGEMVGIGIGDSTIEVTVNHPFWVERGRDLAARVCPGHVDLGADENKSLGGRWVNSQHVIVGDVLVCRDGARRSVESVERWQVQDRSVCNLTIRGQHSFAVGEFAVLVHNTAWCQILESAGRARPRALQRTAERNGWRLHGHHIVQRTVPSQYTEEIARIATEQAMLRTPGLTRSQQAAWYIGKSHEILNRNNIPVLIREQTARAFAEGGAPLHNLAWAVNGNGTHTLETIRDVYQRLNEARGSREGVIEALQRIAEIFERGALPQDVAR